MHYCPICHQACDCDLDIWAECTHCKSEEADEDG